MVDHAHAFWSTCCMMKSSLDVEDSRNMWRWISPIWKRLLESNAMTRYLLLTNVVSGVAVDVSGDFIVQKMIERTSAYDYPRTSRMAIVGVSLTVPDHYWYKLLDKRCPSRTPKAVTLKVVLDCFIMGPVNIALFYLGMCKLEGHSWTDSLRELDDKFLVTFMLDLAIFPAAQALNFYYVPPAMRLMYLNGVYLIWSVILSYLKHNELHHQTKSNSDR